MSKQYPKISELPEIQRRHMAWRLDHNTACGYLTACGICSLRYEAWRDMPINEVFEKAGDITPHAAKILSRKVLKFKLQEMMNKPPGATFDWKPVEYADGIYWELIRGRPVLFSLQR